MTDGAETFVVVNYGAARARAAWDVVRRELAGAGVKFEAHEAREFGDARESARAALVEGYRTVAAVGGDGTLSEVVSGFFAGASSDGAPEAVNPDAALALLPAGTGNDFARAVEGRRASLGHWLARLVAHCRGSDDAATRGVDVLRGEATGTAGVRPFLCLNAVTLGIGAEVAARVAAQGRPARKLSGEMRFALAAAGALAGWRERRARIRVDAGEAWECETNLVAVVNSRFAGGGMMFSPEARVDDGLLDVVTACRVPRRTVVREMARIHRGGHMANPRVRLLRGASVSIEPVTPADALPVEADGDVRGTTPLTLRVLPRALRVVV
ncbi:MAG TPA: diacylglycerol kinase family protein [Pyrinomonadaceae bacterium]|nr:diacylglycerol kinase family protein [Pyrinomonadaceae bacterium]